MGRPIYKSHLYRFISPSIFNSIQHLKYSTCKLSRYTEWSITPGTQRGNIKKRTGFRWNPIQIATAESSLSKWNIYLFYLLSNRANGLIQSGSGVWGKEEVIFLMVLRVAGTFVLYLSLFLLSRKKTPIVYSGDCLSSRFHSARQFPASIFLFRFFGRRNKRKLSARNIHHVRLQRPSATGSRWDPI